MSGWLHDVLDAYLETVSEREFDAPFISYLTAAAFTDIHQLHGAFEFGKDFIAKRDGRQWAFQTKAGDMNLGEWRAVRPQAEEMLWNDISHPSWDATLPRTAVVVTTGRLKGGAAPDAQQFAQLHRDRGGTIDGAPKLEVEVWDRDTLMLGLSAEPKITLDAWGREPLGDLLGLIADTDRRDIDRQRIERQTRSWVDQDPLRTSLAGALVAQHLAGADRVDLACTTALALMRVGAVGKSSVALNAGRAMYRVYGEALIDQLAPVAHDPRFLDHAGRELPAGVTYAIRCHISIETTGMLGLLDLADGNGEGARGHADALTEFLAKQPGASHPVSDRWAMSLIPPALLLVAHDRDSLVRWLESVVVWVCDHHENSFGFASSSADPDTEVLYLLGGPYEHIDLRKRTQSFIATIILDLAACLELEDLYADAWNDFAAVGIAFPAIEVADERGQYLFNGTGVIYSPNIEFQDPATVGTDWQRGHHHERAHDAHELDQDGRSWELLAISLLLRDRHFLTATRHLASDACSILPGEESS